MKILILIINILIFPPNIYSEDRFCDKSIFKSDYQLSALDKLIKDWRCPECKDVKTSCPSHMIKEFPEVIIIGEKHDNQISGIIKKKLIQSALKTNNVLLTEVLEDQPAFPWIKTSHSSTGPIWYDRKEHGGNLYGIDSIIPNTLGQNYFYLRDLIHGIDQPLTTVQNFLKLIELSPLARGAFEELKNNSELVPLYEKIKKYISLKYEGKKSEANQVLLSIPGETLYKFIVFMHKKIIDIAKKEFKEHIFQVNLPYVLNDKEAKSFGLYPDGKIGGDFMELFLRVRDNHFAAKINDHLCDLVKEKKKKVFILLGDAHVKGVKSMLEGLSSYSLKITYLRSYNDREAEILYGLID